ncbi:MAG: hypothetical protein PUG67_03495 [Peptoniphilaceae bacterium]|nr:hypothetical protein [Peptoniphilaceae bacterium]MDY6018380.1 hypothetical protein [Anaerococcus sp.]
MKKASKKYILLVITFFILAYIFIDGFNIYKLNKKDILNVGTEYIKSEDSKYKLDKDIAKNDSEILIFVAGDNYKLVHFRKTFIFNKYKLIKDDTISFSKGEEVNDIIENSFYDYLLRIDFKNGTYDISLKKVKDDKFKYLFWQVIFLVFVIFIIDGIKKKR